MRVYFYLFIFLFQGFSYRPNGHIISLEDLLKRKLKVLVLFLSDQKWRANSPPPTLIFFQKSPDQNYDFQGRVFLAKNIVNSN